MKRALIIIPKRAPIIIPFIRPMELKKTIFKTIPNALSSTSPIKEGNGIIIQNGIPCHEEIKEGIKAIAKSETA